MPIFYEAHRDHMPLPFIMRANRNICMAHFHAGVELVYMLRGQLDATINGRNMILNEKQLLVVNCYSVHRFLSPDSDTITAVIPLSVVPSMQKMLTANRFNQCIIDDENGDLGRLMAMLVDHPENEFMQKGLCYTILGNLLERIPLEPLASTDQVDIICKILNYLNENFTQQITVDQLAARFGYSRSRFSHMFKSTIGYSLPQYMNMLRCRSIAEALVSTDAPVVELAINAGFNNTHSFYTAFKACYNMTPREYLARHRQSRKEGSSPSAQCNSPSSMPDCTDCSE